VHILEFMVELSLFFLGVTTRYGQAKTLTDASVRNCKGDLVAFRPTIMVGAVWETIRKGIIAKVNTGGAVKKTMFNGAMTVKRASVDCGQWLRTGDVEQWSPDGSLTPIDR
jgi:long-chain acyl-CoA synthetase